MLSFLFLFAVHPVGKWLPAYRVHQVAVIFIGLVFNKLPVLVYLFLIVIILTTVHGLELTAIDADGGFSQQACIAKKLYIEPEHGL